MNLAWLPVAFTMSVLPAGAQQAAPATPGPAAASQRPAEAIDHERARQLYVSKDPADHSRGTDFALAIAQKAEIDRRYAEVARGVAEFSKVKYRSSVGDLEIPAYKGPSYQRDFATQKRIQGLPFEKRDIYIERSPLYHVDKLQVPLLVHVATNDTDVNFVEDQQMVDALRSRKSLTSRRRRYTSTRRPDARAGDTHSAASGRGDAGAAGLSRAAGFLEPRLDVLRLAAAAALPGSSPTTAPDATLMGFSGRLIRSSGSWPSACIECGWRV